MAPPPPSFGGHTAAVRRGPRKNQATASGRNEPAAALATPPRPRRRLFPSSPFLLATLLVLLAAAAVRPAASEAAAADNGDGNGDSPVLKAAVGKVEPPAVGDGGDGSGDEATARPPEGMYFFLSAKAPRRCFVVTEGKGSTVHVHYDFPAAKRGEVIKLELRTLSDGSTPKNRFAQAAIETKIMDKERDSHQFKIKEDAKYSLCAVSTHKATSGRGLKLYLDLDTGLQDKHYDRVKKEFNLDDVQIAMIQRKNEAQQMLREADLAEDAESDYHRLLLQLNHEVLWWPVSQVVILVVMGFYQVRHLKSFFKSKRLV